MGTKIDSEKQLKEKKFNKQVQTDQQNINNKKNKLSQDNCS